MPFSRDRGECKLSGPQDAVQIGAPPVASVHSKTETAGEGLLTHREPSTGHHWCCKPVTGAPNWCTPVTPVPRQCAAKNDTATAPVLPVTQVHFERCAIQKKFDRISTKLSPTTTKFHSGDHKLLGYVQKIIAQNLVELRKIQILPKNVIILPKEKSDRFFMLVWIQFISFHSESSVNTCPLHEFNRSKTPQKLGSTRLNKNKRRGYWESKNCKMGTKTRNQNLKPRG